MSSTHLDITCSRSVEVILRDTELTHACLTIAYTMRAVTLQNQHVRKLRQREAKERGHTASKS